MSRQLVRHYFPDHETLMLAVCDHLAQVYRDLLVNKARSLEGPSRIATFLDFYFDLLADAPKPRDDRVYDAMFALAAHSEAIRDELAGQYQTLGQLLHQEFVVQYPELTDQSASEISYLVVSLIYGHWKMVASLGHSEEHNKVSRQAIDRLIQSYIAVPPSDSTAVKVWERKAPN